jgi:hypothetical protein
VFDVVYKEATITETGVELTMGYQTVGYLVELMMAYQVVEYQLAWSYLRGRILASCSRRQRPETCMNPYAREWIVELSIE